MSDLFIDRGEDGGPGEGPGLSNAPEMTVSEVSGRIKRTMEDAFGHVRVRGEVGRVSRPRSGHIYLDLKDDRSVLSGVVWRGVASGLKIQPEEGMEVIAQGRITTFPGQSKYQLVIESMAPAGAGALMAMLEERKKKLAAEGLFAEERKRPIPYLPQVIGVVTSPSGAVIRDILHRLSDRFPRHVLLWPVAVQGEKCAPEVARAVAGFNKLQKDGPIPRPDVLIVARGGGSVEDLWGFNEEIVARAVVASEIPVISAVGHETDTTLIDFVSDRRAPTPTAAAEIAVPVRSELLATVAGFEERRLRAFGRGIQDRRQRLRDLSRALPRPAELVGQARQRFDYASDRLPRALLAFTRGLDGRLGRVGSRLLPGLLTRRLDQAGERVALFGDRLGPALARTAGLARDRFSRARYGERMARAERARLEQTAERLEKMGRLLNGFSYKATLERGYAAVRGPDGVISKAADIAPGSVLELEFSDGRASAVAGEAGKRAAPEKKKVDEKKKSDEPQGSLF